MALFLRTYQMRKKMNRNEKKNDEITQNLRRFKQDIDKELRDTGKMETKRKKMFKRTTTI